MYMNDYMVKLQCIVKWGVNLTLALAYTKDE